MLTLFRTRSWWIAVGNPLRVVLLDEKHLKRFQREARMAAHLHHTNIVEVFGVGEQDGFHYYVMQYIEGVGLDAVVPELAKALRSQAGAHPPVSETLAAGAPEHASAAATVRRLVGKEAQPSGRLEPAYWGNVARMGLQAAEALIYAHGQGVLHRDITPAYARKELEESIATLVRLVGQNPEMRPPHEVLGLGYDRLAAALRQTGERERAEEAARKEEAERNAVRRGP